MANPVEVRRLNQDGLARFANVEWQATGASGDPPSEILFDDDFSEVVVFSTGNTRTIDADATFTSGTELANLIDDALGNKIDLSEIDDDNGLWAWFSLLYYDQLRKGETGAWQSCNSASLIPSGSSLSYYRHLVFIRYAIHRMHGAAATVFLHGPAKEWGEVREQILSVSLIVSSSSIIGTANRLYHDSGKASGFKAGAGGKGGGSARRFRDVFWQLYETYDLRVMTPDEILALLPAEFDRFNPLKVEEE